MITKVVLAIRLVCAAILLTAIASCSTGGGSEESVTTTTFSGNNSIADSGTDATDESAEQVAPVLDYAGNQFILGTALQVRRVNGQTHSHREIHFSDGLLVSSLVDLQGVEYEVWGPTDASIWLVVELFAPLGANGFDGSYRSLPSDADSNSDEYRDVYFFRDARLGIDLDGDGDISPDAGEQIEVVFGSVDLLEEGSSQRFIFNLVLSDGISLSGNFAL